MVVYSFFFYLLLNAAQSISASISSKQQEISSLWIVTSPKHQDGILMAPNNVTLFRPMNDCRINTAFLHSLHRHTVLFYKKVWILKKHKSSSNWILLSFVKVPASYRYKMVRHFHRNLIDLNFMFNAVMVDWTISHLTHKFIMKSKFQNTREPWNWEQ